MLFADYTSYGSLKNDANVVDVFFWTFLIACGGSAIYWNMPMLWVLVGLLYGFTVFQIGLMSQRSAIVLSRRIVALLRVVDLPCTDVRVCVFGSTVVSKLACLILPMSSAYRLSIENFAYYYDSNSIHILPDVSVRWTDEDLLFALGHELGHYLWNRNHAEYRNNSNVFPTAELECDALGVWVCANHFGLNAAITALSRCRSSFLSNSNGKYLFAMIGFRVLDWERIASTSSISYVREQCLSEVSHKVKLFQKGISSKFFITRLMTPSELSALDHDFNLVYTK